MEDYLVDREILGKFVDDLIKKKPLPVNDAAELNQLREKSIKELDDEIGTAIFSSLSDEENEKLYQLLERDEATPETYDRFFKEAGINLEEIITKVMQDFGTKFLGGENV